MFTNTDYYSHEFTVEGDVIAALFTCKSGTQYRVYFYPYKEYNIAAEEGTIIYDFGYLFGFTKVGDAENKKEGYDSKIRNTIVNIINEFYDEQGMQSILIFHCSSDWGTEMKIKRANRFNEWFLKANTKHCFNKIDEPIVVNEIDNITGEIITDYEYLSLIIECNNPDIQLAISQFQDIKDEFVAGK